MKFTTSYFLALASFAISSVVAAPLAARDVYVPPVTAPEAGDTWYIGGTYTVSWDDSSKPAQITNPNGRIQLRKGEATLTDFSLAEGFDITSMTEIEVTVPEFVEPGEDYRIVLFGNSGNWSPVFTIAAPPE
ncbi:hypothetical protein AX16_002103 [Volvariella volvacea WC 439]|nr:hypothetical protein AX16_002103 [Volvariella volvacea WC 439]